jgi:beta-lactam-binding protein with PASTA domain
VKELRFWAQLLLLGIVAGSAVFYTVVNLSVKGGSVTMPDLKGLPKAAADAKLQGLGLSMQVREERFNNAAAYSAVLEQNIEAGATIKRGRVIAVVVSLGSQHLTVPQFVGMPSARQARLLLEQNGLFQGVLDYLPSELPRETVLAQSPEGGQAVARGDSVALLVSSGPPLPARLMPDLRGQSLDNARSLAGRMGLVLRRVVEVAAGGPPGSVLAQSLTPSARVEAGQELALTVVPGGENASGARLVPVSYDLDESGVQERRVRLTVRDSRGERIVHNAMEQPGAHIAKEIKVYGPAKLSVAVGGQLVEEKDLP